MSASHTPQDPKTFLLLALKVSLAQSFFLKSLTSTIICTEDMSTKVLHLSSLVFKGAIEFSQSNLKWIKEKQNIRAVS